MSELILLASCVVLSKNALAQILPLHNRTLHEVIKPTSGTNQEPEVYVGNEPDALAIESVTFGLEDVIGSDIAYGYIANRASNTVSVISIENNTKVKDIPVGLSPQAIAIDEDRDRVYVANYESRNVSVISMENNRRIGNIPVGEGPIDIVIVQNTGTLVVANSESNDISIITFGNNRYAVRTIPVGLSPQAIAIDEDRGIIYVANGGSGTVSAISIENNRWTVDNIPVGEGPIDSPSDIAIGLDTGTVYVANYASGTVSAISIENNRWTVDNIPVGEGPMDVEAVSGVEAVGGTTKDIVFVANSFSDSVSVITNNGNATDVKTVTAGMQPIAISSRHATSIAYVANVGSNTVSVISGENNTKIKDIPVGLEPQNIGINLSTGTVYVTNRGSNSISVIDETSNRVVAGITFSVNPFNSGYILCDDLTTPSPIGQYLYVWSGTECVAKPNEGFEFVSWEENLGGNATQPLQVSRDASSWDSFVLSVTDFFGEKPDEPEATLHITKFGTFTANFREAPPPLPPEFWAQMYAVIGTVVTALFIPSIVGWFKSKREAKKLNYFHKKIDALNQDGNLDEKDIKTLDDLRNRIENAYPEGKLNDKHYESLSGKISGLYEEIYRKKIAALDNDISGSVVKKPTQQQFAEIRNEIKYAFSKGKLNDKHYALLNEDISKLMDGKESNSMS